MGFGPTVKPFRSVAELVAYIEARCKLWAEEARAAALPPAGGEAGAREREPRPELDEDAATCCHAGKDGECNWTWCPQRRDYRGHCPLDFIPLDALASAPPVGGEAAARERAALVKAAVPLEVLVADEAANGEHPHISPTLRASIHEAVAAIRAALAARPAGEERDDG
jgi:hypothetical protein